MEKRQKLEIDIEFKDLLLEFVRCWKLILCCAVIGGVLLGGVSFVKSMQAANTPQAPVVENTTTQPTPQDIIDALTLDELPDVVAAVELKAQIDDKTAYLQNSVLMKIDPFQVNRIAIEYLVTSDNLAAAADSFENMIANTMFLENAYMNELVSVKTDAASNVMVVEVVHADESQCVELAEAVKAAWDTQSKILANKGVISGCQLLSANQSVVVEEALHEKQDTYLKDCMSDQDTLAKMKADMNANQVSGYMHMWNMMYGEETEEEAVEETVNTPVNTEPAKASISMTQVVLGLAAGAILAMVYVFVAYIVTGKLRTAKEVEKLYGVKLLGTLQASQACDVIAASISIQCQQQNTKKVYISGSKLAEIPENLVSQLETELKALDITMELGADVTKDAKALLAAAETGNVVLLEKTRVSAYKDMLKSVQMCENNHITILGMVVAE